MKKELKFIHITKCAGTFIEDLGYKNNILWGRFHKEYGFWHSIFIDKNKELKEKYDWFVIVRNPYDRILSEYYCKWGGIGKNNEVHTKEEFNSYIMGKIYNRSLSGHHYTEQCKYIDVNYKFNVVRLETIKKDLLKLLNEYKINIKPNFDNKINEGNKMRFTINDFSDELIEYINVVYHNDFELFNYEKKTKNN